MKINLKKTLEDKVKFNLEDIKNNLNASEYKIKIKKWSQKFDFKYGTILNKVKMDLYFRAHFAKDPLKQNIIEKTVADHIKQIIGVIEFQKLNNFGKNSFYLNSGQIISYQKHSLKETKSINFKWNIETLKNNKLECYAYHKYINESGGAQDNQYRGIVNTIENSPFNQAEKKLLFIICDGNYFTEKKLEELEKKKKNNSCCFILKTNNLEKKIKYLKNNY